MKTYVKVLFRKNEMVRLWGHVEKWERGMGPGMPSGRICI